MTLGQSQERTLTLKTFNLLNLHSCAKLVSSCLQKYIDFSEINTCNSTKIYDIDLTYGHIESQDQALIIYNIIMLQSNLHIVARQQKNIATKSLLCVFRL